MKAATKAIALLTVYLWIVFVAFSVVLSWLYPYPPNASRETIVAIWSVHVTAEKFLAFAISSIISIVGVTKSRSKLGAGSVLLGSFAGVPFHLLGGAVYLYRFGIGAYLENSQPLGLFGIVVFLSLVASSVTYLLLKRADAQPGAPADAPRPAGSGRG
jgi:hypothetical protein